MKKTDERFVEEYRAATGEEPLPWQVDAARRLIAGRYVVMDWSGQPWKSEFFDAVREAATKPDGFDVHAYMAYFKAGARQPLTADQRRQVAIHQAIKEASDDAKRGLAR